MYSKTYSDDIRKLASKPGKLNPMFGKHHSEVAKKNISDKISKHPKWVGIYDLNDILI